MNICIKCSKEYEEGFGRHCSRGCACKHEWSEEKRQFFRDNAIATARKRGQRVWSDPLEAKECPKCRALHFEYGKLCSRKCANSRNWTQEDKDKKRSSQRGRPGKPNPNKGKPRPEETIAKMRRSWTLRGFAVSEIFTDETKKRLGELARARWADPEWRARTVSALRGKAGGYRIGAAHKSIGCWYDSPTAGHVWLDSTYELRYAKWLDERRIVWNRNKDRFPYEFEGRQRSYIPDFYLVEEDLYVETKNYPSERDLAKWKSFPRTLKVIYGNDLISIGA